ncbi:hypothetical protein Tco_0082902 [Tanacetum coccineum]
MVSKVSFVDKPKITKISRTQPEFAAARRRARRNLLLLAVGDSQNLLLLATGARRNLMLLATGARRQTIYCCQALRLEYPTRNQTLLRNPTCQTCSGIKERMYGDSRYFNELSMSCVWSDGDVYRFDPMRLLDGI